VVAEAEIDTFGVAVAETLDGKRPRKLRRAPLLRSPMLRTATGLLLLGLSVAAAWKIHGRGSIVTIGAIEALAWGVALLLTHKYVQKYPQQYFGYLAASHLKAATVMALGLALLGVAAGAVAALPQVLWTVFGIFVVADFIVSIPSRQDTTGHPIAEVIRALREAEASPPPEDDAPGEADGETSPGAEAKSEAVHDVLDDRAIAFVEEHLPDVCISAGDVLWLNDIPEKGGDEGLPPVRLIVGRTRLNDVLRLNKFLHFCAGRLAMGGFLAVRYQPLENVKKDLRRRYPGVLYGPAYLAHFLWRRALPKIPWLDKVYFAPCMRWLDRLCLAVTKRRGRVLAKAEVWGRLAFCGMDVVAESEESNENGERIVLAKRVASPVRDRRPTYYFIVRLAKVGLDGETIYAHKFRTMYPFSEFIQKRLFQDHGLTATGKFARDFRLTSLGKLIRRYWLDELPQVLDWLQGDIKLVGIRATSRHFLTLYPDEFLELYLQVKPGLVPPIFDEATGGFDGIVRTEMRYLESYWKHPFRTDVRCFWQTFVDIFFRGVRSR